MTSSLSAVRPDSPPGELTLPRKAFPVLISIPTGALINAVIEDRPDSLTIGVQKCRGNFRSTWFAESGYEPIAEVLITEMRVDAYFLEYDDERSGDFSPLRFVPEDKAVKSDS